MSKTNQFSKLTAKHLHDVIFGKNWTAVNLKEVLNDITWQEATFKVYDLNSIATLVFHINYYAKGAIEYFTTSKLTIKDKFSFDHPPIGSDQDWNDLVESVYADIRILVKHIESLDDDKMFDVFADEKWGNHFRNLQGIVEHAHYHLGQIVLLKKMIRGSEFNASL